MAISKPLKKSETLEIRIPYSTKTAFMAQCRRDGSSASAALRTLIDRHVEDGGAMRRRPNSPASGPRKMLHLVAGALVAAALGAIAVPSLARPVCALSPNAWTSIGTTQSADSRTRDQQLRAQFARMDANNDGKITFDEFRRSYEGASTDIAKR